MRILVLSDSHGNVENMARCVELTQPNAILHLGWGKLLRNAAVLLVLFFLLGCVLVGLGFLVG